MASARIRTWNRSFTEMSLIIFALKFILPLIKPIIGVAANLFLGETIGTFLVNSVYGVINLIL